MFGRIIRHDPAFAPGGTNVNFVTVHGPDAVALRTYERGVEAETLACGTGSVAAAIVASVVHGVRPPVKVHVRSGETLSVDFRREGNTIDPVELTGSAELLFEGEFRYDVEHARIRR